MLFGMNRLEFDGIDAGPGARGSNSRLQAAYYAPTRPLLANHVSGQAVRMTG